MVIIKDIKNWDKSPSQYESNPSHNSVLLGSPSNFDIVAAHNAHMKKENGTLKSIDRSLAQKQWEGMVEEFQRLGLKINILKSNHDLHCK